MIPREAESTLHRLAKGFPVLYITGPRQSGKTTLVRKAFPNLPYLSLEDPDIARIAKEDPRGLLQNYEHGVILDEAQYVPSIFPYLKTLVDSEKSTGLFAVTGSQQFDLLAGVTESLAGRAAFLTLLPFSTTELMAVEKLPSSYLDLCRKGFYPPLFDRDVSPRDWYTNYSTSYVERDLRQILNVRDLSQFQLFLKMCAARIGQLLNLSALATDCGITHNTAKAWISVLESAGIIFLLRPYYKNYGKRLVKTPKLYFVDPGLATRLLGINETQSLFLHPLRGSIFESLVISDILKSKLNQGIDPQLYFWRDNLGHEVDLIDDETQRAYEIKSSGTFSTDYLSGLEDWQRFSGQTSDSCFLIYSGETATSYKGIHIVPWNGIRKRD